MNGIMYGGDTAGCGSAGEVDTNRSTTYSQAGVDLAFAAITAGVDLHRKPEPDKDEEYQEAAFTPRSSATIHALDPERTDDWGDLGGDGDPSEPESNPPRALVSC